MSCDTTQLLRKATLVRIRRRDVRARVEGQIRVEFLDEALSSYGGLELLQPLVVRHELHFLFQEDGWPAAV